MSAISIYPANTILVIGTLEATDMLHVKASSAIVLPDGTLIIENEADMPTISALKGAGLNLAVLLRESLHLL